MNRQELVERIDSLTAQRTKGQNLLESMNREVIMLTGMINESNGWLTILDQRVAMEKIEKERAAEKAKRNRAQKGKKRSTKSTATVSNTDHGNVTTEETSTSDQIAA